jgi:multidrug/hemolysin transport system ATP-binding protein
MEEAAGADNVIILDSGHIAAEGTPHDLKSRFSADYITLYDISEEEAKLISLPYEQEKGIYKVKVNNTAEATKLITKHPEIFRDYEITKGGMDDVFLAVTGRALGGEEK